MNKSLKILYMAVISFIIIQNCNPMTYIPQQPRLTTVPQKQQLYQASTPVPAGILDSLFTDIDKIWKLYTTTPRDANLQFSDSEKWKDIVILAQNIQGWTNGSYNDALKAAGNNLLRLFTDQNPRLLVGAVFAEHLNKIIMVANNIINANLTIYQQSPSLFTMQSHALITEKGLLMSGGSIPGIYSAQKAASGTLYDWTKWAAQPITPIVKTGWEYGKWAAGKIGSGLGGVRKWMLPSESEIKLAREELPIINTSISTLKSIENPTSEDLALLQTLEAKKYYYESILGWTPTLLKIGAAGAGLLAVKSGVPSDALRGAGRLTKGTLQTAGSATKAGLQYTGAGAVGAAKLGIGAVTEGAELVKGAAGETWQLTKEAAGGAYGLVKGQ